MSKNIVSRRVLEGPKAYLSRWVLDLPRGMLLLCITHCRHEHQGLIVDAMVHLSSFAAPCACSNEKPLLVIWGTSHELPELEGTDGAAGLKEEDTPEEDAADTEALASTSHGLKDTAIWRVTDGPGAPPELAGRTPVANRTAAGRLDFVLQVRRYNWPLSHM